MRPFYHHTGQSNKGQSLVEYTLAAGLMVGLMLASPYIRDPAQLFRPFINNTMQGSSVEGSGSLTINSMGAAP